jgi:hypothetical protein
VIADTLRADVQTLVRAHVVDLTLTGANSWPSLATSTGHSAPQPPTCSAAASGPTTTARSRRFDDACALVTTTIADHLAVDTPYPRRAARRRPSHHSSDASTTGRAHRSVTQPPATTSLTCPKTSDPVGTGRRLRGGTGQTVAGASADPAHPDHLPQPRLLEPSFPRSPWSVLPLIRTNAHGLACHVAGDQIGRIAVGHSLLDGGCLLEGRSDVCSWTCVQTLWMPQSRYSTTMGKPLSTDVTNRSLSVTLCDLAGHKCHVGVDRATLTQDFSPLTVCVLRG